MKENLRKDGETHSSVEKKNEKYTLRETDRRLSRLIQINDGKVVCVSDRSVTRKIAENNIVGFTFKIGDLTG